MHFLNCPFRRAVQESKPEELAVCGFVERLTGAAPELCVVDQSACELCLQHPPLAPGHLSPVMPSLILSACLGMPPSSDRQSPTSALATWAMNTIDTERDRLTVPWSLACDVLLVCGPEDGEQLEAALDSIEQQEKVHAIVHVVADGAAAIPSVDRFSNRPDIRIHRHLESRGIWTRFNELLPLLETQFIALQMPGIISPPRRLQRALARLDQRGGELLVSPETLVPAADDPPFQTLVARRGTLVDLGGFDPDHTDPWSEFLSRAFQAGRSLLVAHGEEETSVTSLPFQPKVDAALGLDTPSRSRLLNPHRRGSLRCDVVIPFRDQLDYVRESLDALLRQESVDLVIHLIDDASREPTEAFFAEYRQHEQFRFYRNTLNIGPFATFNNISEFAETPFIAVQDADDISLPQRFATCGELLELSGADMIAGRTEMFGLPERMAEIVHESRPAADGQPRHYRLSRYPSRMTSGYFLENPTLMLRVAAFRRLGGYADFGERNRNRTGVDTDLQLRAYFSRTPIMMTDELLVRYRCHGASATMHPDSGVESSAYQESNDEVRRRLRNYLTGTFDPRWYGALRLHAGVTRRI